MTDFTIPAAVAVGDPVEASDHNTTRTAIVEIASALNSIENGQLIDGSFEQGLESWVATNISGGSNSIETTTVIHGAQSFKATATAGGGYVDLDSDDFLNVSALIDDVFMDGRIYVTAQVKVQAWIEWFDKDDVSISTQQIMDYTFGAGELNTWKRMRGYARAVATARSYKLLFQLGDGTVAGDIYLDGITTRLNAPYPWIVESTPVKIFDNNTSGQFNVAGAVIGIAHALHTYYVDDASANVDDEFMYDRDAGAWVSVATSPTMSGSAAAVSNYTFGKYVGGLITNADGEYRVDRGAGGGGLEIYRSMWR